MNKKFSNIEKNISNKFSKQNSLLTRNGTTAIWLLLMALGLKQKKIVVPSNICFVVNSAIILSNNFVHFIDIDDNYSLDPNKLKKLEDEDIGAIIYPHMYGNIGKIEEIVSLAKKNNWIIIEDVCQALGSTKDGKSAGSFSDYAVSSFGIGKIIDVGIGGALSTNSDKIYYEAIKINNRLQFYDKKLDIASRDFSMKYNSLVNNFDDKEFLHRTGEPLIRAFKDVFINKLNLNKYPIKKLEDEFKNLNSTVEIRNNNATLFQNILDVNYITPLVHNEGSTYWRQNILVSKERDQLLDFLKNNGIKASKYFPSIDKYFYYSEDHKFKNSTKMEKQIINLWTGKETKIQDITHIQKVIRNYYKSS